MTTFRAKAEETEKSRSLVAALARDDNVKSDDKNNGANRAIGASRENQEAFCGG
jgi:hypothetical protein